MHLLGLELGNLDHQIQSVGYQPQRQMQLQQSQDGFRVQQGAMGGQFGSTGYAMSQNAMYQQRLQQLKQQQQQQQQQEAPGPEQYGSDQGAQSQYGSPTRAQDQKALYQGKQQQQMLQQQQQQQQQLQLHSFGQAGQRLGDEAVSYSQGMESNASGSGFSQLEQLVHQGQFGSAGYAQSQSAIYQQKLMQQRQKQQQLKQQQQQQQQQQLLQGPRQEAGMDAVQQPGYAPNPLYQQQGLQQQQQPSANASASGQLGSAQYAQGQAAMYQQRLQQLKQRQQQQQQQQRESAEPTPGPNQASQSHQQGQQMQVQSSDTYQANLNSDRQMLSVAASTGVQAAASSAVPVNQMGSVGFALAQNAKYQQQLQQQQLRRQQRQQLEQQQQQQLQQQLQQQPAAQMQPVQARQQQQQSQQSAPARLPLSNEVSC